MFQRCCLVFAGVLATQATAFSQTLDPALVPTSASRLVSSHPARGVQIYACPADGRAWTLKAPEAELLDADGKPFVHHYAGPTWQATDGSKVVGTLVAKVAAPRQGDIPWLLLSAKATGPGILDGTHYVQRIDTHGGVADAGACPSGQELRVPYTATYRFFR